MVEENVIDIYRGVENVISMIVINKTFLYSLSLFKYVSELLILGSWFPVALVCVAHMPCLGNMTNSQ